MSPTELALKLREKFGEVLSAPAEFRGEVTLVLTIPHDFEVSIVRTGSAPIQLAVNAEKGSAAGIVTAVRAAATVGEFTNEWPRSP